MSSHRLTERQIQRRIREFAPVRDADARQLAELDRRWAVLAVEVFNARLAAGRLPVLSPTVGAALLAGRHWLHILCPACQTVGAVDLTMVPRPADMAVTAVLPSLRCRSCEGRNPVPAIVGISGRHDTVA